LLRWRWARDHWFSTGGAILKYDKLEHFLLYFFGTFFLSFSFPNVTVLVSLFAAGLI
jgi:hypothetical protein